MFVSHEATSEDLEDLELWISNSSNYLVFKEYVKTQFAIQLSMNEPDSTEIKDRLLKEIRKDKNVLRRRKFKSVFKYAAIALIFVSIGYLFKTDFLNDKKDNLLVPRHDAITLQLENGDIEILSEDGTSQVLNESGEIIGTRTGNRLNYKETEENKVLIYNTLTVPYSKRFEIMLSDGTEVFLNAGSKLKYPVNFIKGSKRRVFVQGEAFFDVAHDAENPFIIGAHELDIEVLGTRFNVSNYEEDQNTEVVLVNGSVELTTSDTLVSDSKVLLKPGYKASFDKSEKSITSEPVNTSVYTSWMKGQIVFRNSSFDNILEKLQRHYNIVIINNNTEIVNETFNATIEVDNETIKEVLEYFDKIYGIDYEIFNNKIIIN